MAPVALVEEAPVPGLGQAQLEVDGVGLGIDRTGALGHAAGEQAVLVHRLARDTQRAGLHAGGAEDLHAWQRQPACELAAGLQGAGPGRRQARQRSPGGGRCGGLAAVGRAYARRHAARGGAGLQQQPRRQGDGREGSGATQAAVPKGGQEHGPGLQWSVGCVCLIKFTS
jgi:hypothetical protein